MSNIEKVNSFEEATVLAEKAINKAGGVLEWFQTPSEEARNNLLDLIRNNKNLTPQEQTALIYKSRKLIREYGNSKIIYEEAKRHFEEEPKEGCVDEDWLHFFFDKAEKVSSQSMQMLWAKLLAGEFNKPGSISRKLMHIISIMDASSAKSFQTFCYYIFEPKHLIPLSYAMHSVLLPKGFYENSFDFSKDVEKWLEAAGYEDYRDLSIQLTMTTGQLNSLENLGLIQQRQEIKSEVPLLYHIDEKTYSWLIPNDGEGFPMGRYTLTTEGNQLYTIIRGNGNAACLEIVVQYLIRSGIDFNVTCL